MTQKEIDEWDSIDVRYVTPKRLAETAVEAAEDDDIDELIVIADVDVKALVEEYQAEQAEEDEEEEELEAPWHAAEYDEDGLTAEEFLEQSIILNDEGDDDE